MANPSPNKKVDTCITQQLTQGQGDVSLLAEKGREGLLGGKGARRG